MKTENVTLQFKQGKSDKLYKVSLEEENDLYLVNFAFGRTGSTLKTGTKTQTPVTYDKAKKIYDKLVKEKSAKGYLPVNNAQPTQYVHNNQQKDTGVYCQLLNPIEADELAKLIANEDWWAQEKQDGKRMLIQKTDELIAINRRGLSVGAPDAMLAAAKAINREFLIDGEAIGDNLLVFDLLMLDGEDLKTKPYHQRLELLENIGFLGAIEVVKTAKTPEEKQALHDCLKQANAEGLVLKNPEATYTAGRPNSGGTQLKFKFYDTASVIVSKVNDKRSVAMMVYDNKQEVNVGNVTIAVNKDIPAVGDVIEVRYLYAYKGGSLYQPTFLEVRTDITPEECIIKQLKYKAE